MLIGFVIAFALTRFIVTSIKEGRRWAPKNLVSKSGLHVHHMVFGIFGMTIFGIAAYAMDDISPVRNLFAFMFGCSLALTYDEFALWLHLEDVYWTREGRQSVDLVFALGAVLALLMVGIAPFGLAEKESEDQERTVVAVFFLAEFLFVLVCALKKKPMTCLVGVFIGLVAVIGAIRVARPSSPWARWFYRKRPAKLAKAEARENQRNDRIEKAHAVAERFVGKHDLVRTIKDKAKM
jgi:lysyl-tRNA synthetase class 2